MSCLEEFLAEQPRLQGLAYRMLGSVSEAEDVVQEAFLRFQRCEEVRHPKAFLTRVVTHLCLDVLRSARHRRETYPGTWLPEPVVTSPEELILADESLRYAFLRLLQELNPKERAAYLLREVLGHGYPEIAEWLEETSTNVRQLVSRARQRLSSGKARYSATPQELEERLGGFLRAVRQGEAEALHRLLRNDIVLWSDAGGKAPAAVQPIRGADKVARFLLGIASKPRQGPPQQAWLNGLPALLLVDGPWRRAFLVEFEQDGLSQVYIVSNPDKLTHLPFATAASTGPQE